MTHTQVPWKAHRAIWDQETGDVAYILEGVKEARAADSYLITAAPDMLEALETIMDIGDKACRDIARAAIQKARGEE